MGVNSDFGIKTAVDNSGVDSLIERLSKLLDTAKTVEKQFGSMFKSDAAQKTSQSFVDADGKITKSRQESSDRQKQLLAEQVSVAESAAKRREQVERQAAKITADAEKKTTTELVDHIFELQKKRESAMQAQKRAVTDGAKAEVAEQKKVIASLDEEIQTLKKVSIQRKEVQREGAGAKIGQLGTGRQAEGFSGKALVEMAGVGAAVEGLSSLVDKAKEVADAAHQMRIAFGKGEELKRAQEDSEKLGEQFGLTGQEAGKSLSLIKSVTAAVNMTEEQRLRLTRAYIAAQEAGLPVAAKSLMTEEGRQKLLAEGGPLIAKAMDDAQDPAKQAQLAVASVEEEGGQLASTLLTTLNPAIHLLIGGLKNVKPILPELLLGIGLLTIAMNAQAIAAKAQAIWNGTLTMATTTQTAATWLLNAAMAVNPFVWIGVAVVALIAGIVLLVTHWKEVVGWFEKAAQTVMNAGGALLHLLGITNDASAATKKHTESVKDNSQSLGDQKQSVEQVTQAYDDYSDALIKNQDEQKKSSDAETKRSEAAIVDIQKKLRFATGANKAALEERLQQYIDYGKAVVSNAKIAAENEKMAADEIGAGKDKKAKDTTAQDDYEALKKSITEKYDLLRENAEENATSDASYKAKSLEFQKEEDEELLKETEDYNLKHSTKKKSLAGMEHKIWVDSHNIQKEAQDKELEDANEANAKALNGLAVRGAQQGLTEREIAKQSYQIKLDGLNAQLALERKFGRDTDTTQKAIDDLERSRTIDDIKQAEAIEKELRTSASERRLNDMKSALEKEKSLSGDHRKEVATQENAIATAEENERYAKELEDRKDDLANATQGKALQESLEANHQGKMRAIAQQGADEQRKIQQEQIAFLLGPVSQSFAKASDLASNSMLKTMGIEQKHKSVFGDMAAGMISDYAKMGLAAIQHANISEIADDASAAGKWALAAANAVAKAFESIPFPLDLVAAAGSIAAVIALAVEAKHIGGHAMGTDSSPGGMKWVGERGPELMNVPRGAQIIPNHRLPNLGQPAQDLTPLLHALNTSNRLAKQSNDTLAAIHSSGKPGYGSSQGLYNLTRGQQIALRIVDRRRVK